jgi:hypothetical protein
VVFKICPDWKIIIKLMSTKQKKKLHYKTSTNSKASRASTSVSDSNAYSTSNHVNNFYSFLLFSTFSSTSLAPETQTRRVKMAKHPIYTTGIVAIWHWLVNESTTNNTKLRTILANSLAASVSQEEYWIPFNGRDKAYTPRNWNKAPQISKRMNQQSPVS